MKKIYMILCRMAAAGCLVILPAASVSCAGGDLEIRQDFPFAVEVMPVPEAIALGEKIEIRLVIEPERTFAETRYFIRYFQYEGAGSLQYYDEPPYLPNDLYPLQERNFRLYYTSASSVKQSFRIWISDTFGNEQELEFEFGNSD